MAKRGRDDIQDDDVSTTAMELGATLGRGLEMKLRVCCPDCVSNVT